VQELPHQVLRIHVRPDSKESLTRTLSQELESCDFLLITGGVSVGDYDYTKEILEELGVTTIFWKVAQRPGKPVYFGLKGQTAVFGLPGNPVSALVCYYEYVRPALRKFSGARGLGLEESTAELVERYQKRPGFSHFVRASAYYHKGRLKVAPLKGQGSHIMRSFSESNCLMLASEGDVDLQPGSLVTVHWLPSTRRTMNV